MCKVFRVTNAHQNSVSAGGQVTVSLDVSKSSQNAGTEAARACVGERSWKETPGVRKLERGGVAPGPRRQRQVSVGTDPMSEEGPY